MAFESAKAQLLAEIENETKIQASLLVSIPAIPNLAKEAILGEIEAQNKYLA
jgi:hypothetical protein